MRWKSHVRFGRRAPETGRSRDRHRAAARPHTYCRTFAGWVYAAFVIDVHSRRVVGWQLSKILRTDLALDALEMGIWARQHAGQAVDGLIHHSDRGVQAVPRHSLHPAPRRGRCRRLGRLPRRLLRQRPRRGLQLAVQGRADPQQGALEKHRRPRDRRRRVHRLVQPPTTARRDRTRPARRVRRHPLPSQPRPDTRRSVSSEPPLNPARDRQPGRWLPGSGPRRRHTATHHPPRSTRRQPAAAASPHALKPTRAGLTPPS
jgi:hypothetical protein